MEAISTDHNREDAARESGVSRLLIPVLMLTLGPIVSSLLLLTNIALAVFKPKRQLARRGREASEMSA
jgi:hypothetical protein